VKAGIGSVFNNQIPIPNQNFGFGTSMCDTE